MMRFINRKWFIGLIAILMLSLFASVSAAGLLDHVAVLNGKVATQGLVKTGDAVKEGQILVNVDTVAGIAPTARSKTAGIVKEVLVVPGDSVRTGQVVVRIEPQSP